MYSIIHVYTCMPDKCIHHYEHVHNYISDIKIKQFTNICFGRYMVDIWLCVDTRLTLLAVKRNKQIMSIWSNHKNINRSIINITTRDKATSPEPMPCGHVLVTHQRPPVNNTNMRKPARRLTAHGWWPSHPVNRNVNSSTKTAAGIELYLYMPF